MSGELGRGRSAFRVASLHSKSLTYVPRVCASPSPVARVRASASSLCCACCGVASVGGGRTLCGSCLLVALGTGDTHNSCLEHGHDVLGGTKTQSTRTRSGVWRPLEGPLSVADKLALGHRGESEVGGSHQHKPVWDKVGGIGARARSRGENPY